MIAVQVAVVGLAAWRLASLLVEERGPGSIFERIRRAAGYHPAQDWDLRPPLAQVFTCMWCMSCWAAALMWALWYVSPIIPGLFAAMAVAMLAERAAPGR